MASPHAYRIFGLNVHSDVAVPHWPAGAPPWDVRVVCGTVPHELPGAQSLWDGAFQGARGRGLLRHPAQGYFLMEQGERVTVEPASRVSPARLIHILGGTAFAALLYQRGVLCLHASAVARQGRGYLIMGPSGAGKSTTASALLARGAEFLCDDIAAVTPGPGGEFLVAPSFPSMRLHADTHGKLAGQMSALEVMDSGETKVRLHYTGAVAAQSVPITRICFLEYDDAIARPRAVLMTGQERLGALHRSLYRRLMGRIVADPARLAEQTLALAQKVEVIRLTRPKQGFAIDAVVSLVLG